MVDQIQRIVLAYDEGNSKAKLEEFNRVLEKQNQAALKAADGLAKAAKEQQESEKAAAKAARGQEQLEKAFAKIRYEQFSKQYGDSTKHLNDFGGQMKEVAGIATGVFVAGMAGATAAYLGLNKALGAGQVLNDLERSFETITEKGGYTQVSLDGLKEATYGLVDSTTLLTQANTAMTLGLPGDELEDLYQKTIRLARAQGVDSVRAIESITIGIARQSKLYLDNLGIILDTEKAYEKFAKANNTTAEALTDSQKKAAFYEATVEALNERVATTAEVQLTAAEALTQAQVAAKDAFAEFGQGITKSDELATSFRNLKTAIVDIDWDALGQSVGTFSGDILGGLNSVVAQATQGITAFKNVVTNFNPGEFLGKFNPADFLKVLAGGPQAGAGLANIQNAVKQFNVEVGGSPELIKPYVEEMARLYDVAGLLPKALREVGKGTGETGNTADDAAKKIASLVEKFKLEGAADQVKGLGDSLNDAIKQIDPKAFDSVLPQFEASFRKLKLDELTEKYKDAIGKGITTAGIAELADSETKKAADKLREQMTEAVKKSADAFAELQREVKWEELQTRLESSIEGMDKGAFDVVSQEMEAQFKKVRFDELRKELGQNIGDPEVWDVVNREWAEQSKDMATDWNDAMKEQFEESTDFFAGLLEGIFEGGDLEESLKNMLERAAIDFGSQILAQLTGNFSLKALGMGSGGQINYLSMLSSLFGGGGASGGGDALQSAQTVMDVYNAGNTAAGLYTGVSTGASAGGGSAYLAGAAGAGWFAAAAAAGAASAYSFYRSYDAAKEGDRSSATGWGAAAGFILGGFTGGVTGGLGGNITATLFSKKSREQKMRDAYRDYLFEQEVIGDPNEAGLGGRKAEFALFGGGYGSLSPGTKFQGLDQGAEGFVGLSNVLSSATTGGRIDTDLSAMFANALAEADSFNAAVLTTKGILEQLGISAEDAGFQMVDAYYRGEIGLDELNAGVNTLIEVAKNDLPSLADGVNLFTESLDDPKSQIPALGLLFQEMAQNGIDSADEMKAFFAENFAPEVAESLNSIVDSGIDTFDELKNLTLGQTQLVINELDAAAKTQEGYTETVIRHGEESEKAAEKSARGLQKERQEVEKNARAYEDARRAKQRYFSEGSTQDFGPQAPG